MGGVDLSAMAERMSAYAIPHKGLRNVLSQFSLLTGKTTVSDPGQMEKLYAIGRDAFVFLDHHAEGENAIILDALRLKDPATVQHILHEHERLEQSQRVAEKDLEELLAQHRQGHHSQEMMSRLYASFNAFHSQYLVHLVDEETNVQPVIWKNFTDEEIIGMSKKIQAQMKPEIMMMMLGYVVPAQSHFERMQFLSEIKKNAPPFVFQKIMETTQRFLPSGEFELLKSEL